MFNDASVYSKNWNQPVSIGNIPERVIHVPLIHRWILFKEARWITHRKDVSKKFKSWTGSKRLCFANQINITTLFKQGVHNSPPQKVSTKGQVLATLKECRAINAEKQIGVW